MRFDQDAYWGLGIGASIASRVPFLGASSGASGARRPHHRWSQRCHVSLRCTSSSFRGSCWQASAYICGWFCIHGVSEWPMPGRLVRKSTYEREYKELTQKTGIPFVPDAAWKDVVFAAAILLVGNGLRFLLRARSAPAVRLIPPSSRPRPSRTSPSSGSIRFSHFFHRRLKRRSSSLHRFSASPPCCCCRCSPARANATGAAVPLPFSHCRSSPSRLGCLHAPRHIYAVESPSWTLGRAMPFLRNTCRVAHRSSAKERLCCRTSNAATATRLEV